MVTDSCDWALTCNKIRINKKGRLIFTYCNKRKKNPFPNFILLRYVLTNKQTLMNKTLHLNLIVKTFFLLALLCISFVSFTNSGGAPTGNTSAPGDGNCTSCHSGALVTSGTNWNNFSISTNVPANGYTPGGLYTVTITHTMAGINKWGFQALVLNSSNAQAGSLSGGVGNQTFTAGTKTYVTHTSGGNTGSGTKTWSFSWVAPNPGVGTVTIYATVNAADGSGGTSGDQIFAKSLSVIELTNLPTADITGIPVSGNVCLGDTLSLFGDGINSPTGFAWTFTGLPSSTLQNPQVKFTTAGTKTITLVTTNAFGNSTTTTKTISVINKPTASLVPSGSTLNKCGTDSVTISTNVNPVFSFLWSPGNQTTPSIKVADTGSYFVRVTNPSTGCFTTTPSIRVVGLPKPIPVLTVTADTICQKDSVLLTASTPFSSYRFFNQNTLLQSGSGFTYKDMFTPGAKQFGLVVTGTNGCVSDTVRKTVMVTPIAPAPTLSCGTKTTSSIEFTWLPVAGAVGYEVTLDTAKTWIIPSGSLRHTVSGLAPNTNVQLQVRAIDNTVCARGAVSSLVCTNGACSPIVYSLPSESKTCLQSAVDTNIIIVQLQVNTSGASVYYASFNNGPYTNQFSYNAKVGLGDNLLSIKILDSLNVGCPRVDTVVHLTGLLPITQVPVMGIEGGLCSSDSAVHTFVVSNANSGADYFNIFRNSDSLPFVKINATANATVSTSMLKLVSPVSTGDFLYAEAVDSTSGCSLVSQPYTATIHTSPVAGFTTDVNALTVTFTDTTAKTSKRNWLFFGEIPDVVNGGASIVKTFATGGNKSIQLVMTDSNGCSEQTIKQITLFNTSIAEVATTDSRLAIYPNPVKDKFSCILESTEEANLQVFDIAGKLVMQNKTHHSMVSVDASSLEKGFYVMYITQGYKRYSAKFMKE